MAVASLAKTGLVREGLRGAGASTGDGKPTRGRSHEQQRITEGSSAGELRTRGASGEHAKGRMLRRQHGGFICWHYHSRPLQYGRASECSSRGHGPDIVVRGEVPAEILHSVQSWIGCIAGHWKSMSTEASSPLLALRRSRSSRPASIQLPTHPIFSKAHDSTPSRLRRWSTAN
jgi:hypothetical protein